MEKARAALLEIEGEILSCLVNAQSRLETIKPMMDLQDGGSKELSYEERNGVVLALQDTIRQLDSLSLHASELYQKSTVTLSLLPKR